MLPDLITENAKAQRCGDAEKNILFLRPSLHTVTALSEVWGPTQERGNQKKKNNIFLCVSAPLRSPR